MSVYNWELSARAQRQQEQQLAASSSSSAAGGGGKKVKRTGLVVLHGDANVDCSFDRLLREHVVPARLRLRYATAPHDAQTHNADSNTTRQHEEHEQTEPHAEDEDGDAEVQGNTIRTPLMQASTVDALRTRLHFDGLLPCQAQCYRGIFLGRDVILHSHTGSGKTLAYALPIIERHLLLERAATDKGNEYGNSNSGDKTTTTAAAERRERKSTRASRHDTTTTTTDASATAPLHAPFMLVFVFSIDLAIQTRDVLSTVYPQLRIAVAGVDVLPAHHARAAHDEQAATAPATTRADDGNDKDNARNVDVLIGTLSHIDQLIRGVRERAAEQQQQPQQREQQRQDSTRKRARVEVATQQQQQHKRGKKARTEAQPAVAASNDDEDNNDKSEHATEAVTSPARSVVSAARVRAIVVDEVDLTLGPRFSTVGRRIKHLLHAIRLANGSLVDGVLGECRRHHYVLCGATIPDWVVRAGFLGVKKYHYALVAVGARKLPSTLQCLQLRCAPDARVRTAVALLTTHRRACALGRTVVFGTVKQILALEEALQRESGAGEQQQQQQQQPPPSPLPSNKTKAKKKASTTAATATTAAAAAEALPVVRTMLACRSEAERVAALRAYNSGVADTMLCTDLAARGLDFAAVDAVVMLSLPSAVHMASETFVHRAGRTARVGRAGRCLLLCDDAERDRVNAVCKTTHVTFTPMTLPRARQRGGDTDKAQTAAADATTTPATTAAAAAAEGDADVVSFVLTVRNPFAYAATQTATATATSSSPPRARAVLRRQLDAAVFAQLRNVADVDGGNGEAVLFAVRAALVPTVRAALWKYDVREVHAEEQTQ